MEMNNVAWWWWRKYNCKKNLIFLILTVVSRKYRFWPLGVLAWGDSVVHSLSYCLPIGQRESRWNEPDLGHFCSNLVQSGPNFFQAPWPNCNTACLYCLTQPCQIRSMKSISILPKKCKIQNIPPVFFLWMVEFSWCLSITIPCTGLLLSAQSILTPLWSAPLLSNISKTTQTLQHSCNSNQLEDSSAQRKWRSVPVTKCNDQRWPNAIIWDDHWTSAGMGNH